MIACAAVLAFLFFFHEEAIGLYHGIHRTPELDEDFKWTKTAAERGDVTAMITVGVELCEKSVLETSIEEQDKMKKEGLMWLQKAADKGDGDAMNALRFFEKK